MAVVFAVGFSRLSTSSHHTRPHTYAYTQKDEATVRSMSRTGARRELLKGPLLYGAVIVTATLLHWRRLTAVRA